MLSQEEINKLEEAVLKDYNGNVDYLLSELKGDTMPLTKSSTINTLVRDNNKDEIINLIKLKYKKVILLRPDESQGVMTTTDLTSNNMTSSDMVSQLNNAVNSTTSSENNLSAPTINQLNMATNETSSENMSQLNNVNLSPTSTEENVFIPNAKENQNDKISMSTESNLTPMIGGSKHNRFNSETEDADIIGKVLGSQVGGKKWNKNNDSETDDPDIISKVLGLQIGGSKHNRFDSETDNADIIRKVLGL